jgi:hypothetical protein
MTQTLKVLCVTGWCRNGSTIIGNILGEVPGFCHVGELHFLWKNAVGMGANNRCGCGAALTDCPVWSRVLAAQLPPGSALDSYAATMTAQQRAYVRTRHTWRVRRRGPHCDAIGEHADRMARTYQAVADLTGARVIVDTSKIVGEAALLPWVDGITPYYVHLVRDPRAVACSWRQPKDYVYALSATTSTAYWSGFNLASREITRHSPGNSLFLRYEDFIADPAASVGALLRLCGADPGANPVRGNVVDLHANHTVTGNPDRFRTGTTVIRDTDDAWRHELPAAAKLAVLALSWPLFGRYGYRYRGTFSTGSRLTRRQPVGSGA